MIHRQERSLTRRTWPSRRSSALARWASSRKRPATGSTQSTTAPPPRRTSKNGTSWLSPPRILFTRTPSSRIRMTTRTGCSVRRSRGCFSRAHTDELALVADNLFGDRVLNLDLFDHQLYEWQSAWYTRKRERFGVPLDSRHLWTKVCTLDSRDSAPSNKVDPIDRLGGTSISDRLRSAIDSFSGLQCFAAASATDVKARDMFIDALVDYLKAGRVDAAFPE